MKPIKFLIALIIITGSVFAQDMRQSSFYSLFSDHKASRQGDAVTILVVESTSASNNSQTSSGRKSDIGLNASGAVGTSTIPETQIGIGTNNAFEGAGSTKTSGNISTKISAVVDTVLANGNLIIRGTKKITINGEEQIITIRGVVRSVDIMPDNSVYSYKISDAQIAFEGNGIIGDSQKPGWLTKLFHWLF